MNEEQRKQAIVAAILGVVIVAVLAYQLTRHPPDPPEIKKAAEAAAKAGGGAAPAPVAPGTTPAPKAAGAEAAKIAHGAAPEAEVNIDELLASIKEVDFDYDKEHKPRDPLAPLTDALVSRPDDKEVKENESATALSPVQVMNKIVSGILWNKQRPLAVVDDWVVYPGYEYPDGTVVESIEEDKVVFKVGDALVQVELKKEL